MSKVPQTLKGFRDFLPKESRERQWLKSQMTKVFESFGFEPIETPTIEYASLIMGKYGQEADKLVYQFTDNGDRQVALPYDQTVPTARVLAQYQNELPKIFRRYSIKSVFRAEKPQKGRYREFIQSDIDIFGTTSPIADAEIIACTYKVFATVGFINSIIKVNDRKSLVQSLKPFTTDKVDVFSIIQSIDKLDKKPPDAIIQELVQKGLSEQSAQEALQAVQTTVCPKSLQNIIDAANRLGVPNDKIQFTPTLARGLDYYTGMILEVIVPEYPVGSFAGGGRYDNLISQLGGPKTPAVGLAFGFDRMLEGAQKLNLLPTDLSTTQILVLNFDPNLTNTYLDLVDTLRQNGFNTEIYPENAPLSKQYKLVDQKAIPWTIIIGSNEEKEGLCIVKNSTTREQTTISQSQLVQFLTGKFQL